MVPLRLVVYDATDTAPLRGLRVERRGDGTIEGVGGLTRFWRLGAALHRGVLRAADSRAVSSWREALRWAVDRSQRAGAPVAELQVWGHGGWGYMGLCRERLDADSIAPSGALGDDVAALRAVLAPDALFWLRCCGAFGSDAGRRFAPALAERLGARVAGHTFIIGAWQSGTHSVAPGEAPAWSAGEGVEPRAGSTACAMVSGPRQPRTITCLHLGLPEGW